VSLYQGDLLPNCYDDWITPERTRLRDIFSYAIPPPQPVLNLLHKCLVWFESENLESAKECLKEAVLLARHSGYLQLLVIKLGWSSI
jgi:hypothetical protein